MSVQETSGLPKNQDRACLVTGAERAAIAVIELHGPRATQILNRCFKTVGNKAYQDNHIRYGTWQGDRESKSLQLAAESVVVVPVSLAASDADDQWEIHCHGGKVAAERILEDLRHCSVIVSDQLAWSLSDKSLLQSELTRAFNAAPTTRTAGILWQQCCKGLADFSEQALVQMNASEPKARQQIVEKARHALSYSSFGLHLTKPWKVTLAGKPNVGKSSLMNAIVGYQRSITHNQPGTTRDTLQADAVIDGWPIQISDTAGIRSQPSDVIEQAGIDRAAAKTLEADLVLWVVDASTSEPATRMSWEIVSISERSLRQPRRLMVFNKTDLAEKSDHAIQNDCWPTVATTGEGIEELRQGIVDALVPSLPPCDLPLPLTERHVDALQAIVAAETDDDQLVAALVRLRNG